MMLSGPAADPDHPGGLIFGVSEVSTLICDLLDDARLQKIWVLGEVTNYKNH